MIYRNNYFNKELRQSYNENSISRKKELGFAIFLGLISFALHFMLQTVTKSVLSDVVPEFMQPSYFSAVYIYINVAFIFNVIYFVYFYEYLSFVEIRRNRWYMLVKMGYKPSSMIFSKLVARSVSVIFIYTVGFLFTLFLTVFLKYDFVYEYLPALYVTGLIDLTLLVTVSMTSSLFIKEKAAARNVIIFSAVIIVIFKISSGYYDIVSNRVLMQNIYNLFNFKESLYLPFSITVILTCIIICFFQADTISKYYNLPYYEPDFGMPEGCTVVLQSPKTGKTNALKSRKYKALVKLLNIITSTALICVVLSILAFNIFVVIISAATPGKEVTVMGVIPYVFKSDTMSPDIMLNDLAYFQKTDDGSPIEKGKIVLFKENRTVYVEKIVSIKENRYTVDINQYPPLAEKKSMKKTIYRDEIYGIYSGRNRWLGALILFANTVIGRFTFLMIPTVLLFFYKPITDFLKRLSNNHAKS